jgi:hypothetical protein
VRLDVKFKGHVAQRQAQRTPLVLPKAGHLMTPPSPGHFTTLQTTPPLSLNTSCYIYTKLTDTNTPPIMTRAQQTITVFALLVTVRLELALSDHW